MLRVLLILCPWLACCPSDLGFARSVVHKAVGIAVAVNADVSVALFVQPAPEGLPHSVDGLSVFPNVPGVVVAGKVVKGVRVDGFGQAQVDNAVAGLGGGEGLS